jgi:hypothetical protein
MSATLNSAKTFRRQNGDIYFIVKSSCYGSQIKVFLKSAAPD